MSKDATFDIVSEFDQQELVNAIDQAKREMTTRFDLKNSNSEISLEDGGNNITITSSDEMRLQNVLMILEDKIVRRGLNASILKAEKVEEALGGRVRQVCSLRKGIDKDLAKKIVAEIKGTKLKVQASIQGEQVRVNGKNRDDLQSIIQHLKEQSAKWEYPLQFTNYR